MESERVTRKGRIDPLLESLGWKVVPFDKNPPLEQLSNCAVEEYETENGPADYALCVDSRIVAVVEAKKLTLGHQNVLTQAERYSRGVAASKLNFDGFRVPFLYSTNCAVIWFHDVRHKLSRRRRVAPFHSRWASREMLDSDIADDINRLETHPNDHPKLRPRQIEASAAVEKPIPSHKRQMLIAMAGTRKTFTLMNQVFV